MARGTRTTLEPGIYADAFGLAAVITVNGERREQRFPVDTPIQHLRDWRLRMRLDLDDRGAGPVARGTLAADVDRYIRQVQTLASWRELRAELRAWTALYGKWRRAKLTHAHVRQARVRWHRAGVAPKTINNRVDALRRLYRTMDRRRDGRTPTTPCDGVEPLPVPKVKKQLVPVDLIVAVAAELERREARKILRNGKTRARFLVLATCGVRPVELMRAHPDDVVLDAPVPYWMTQDAKNGLRPGAMPLNADMVAAWRLFLAADAWGAYETSAFARTLRAAGWPSGLRPYRLRSSVGIELSTRGVDLADVGAFLGHRDLETTRTHYVPVLDARMQTASDRLAGRFGQAFVAPQRGTSESAEQSRDDSREG